jgi:hypothetical protein
MRPGHDLVAAVRAELAAVDPARTCCRAAERAGLGDSALGRARSPVVARLAVRLGQEPLRDPGRLQEGPGRAEFAWGSAPQHCRMTYLRGFFLAHGSLSLSGGATHLEFVVAPEEAATLAARLAECGLPASRRVRRGRGVVTWKSAERVVAFLRSVGAGPALLDLEARGVARVLRSELNRLANADSANAARSVMAAARQMEAIRLTTRSGRLEREREVVQSVAGARVASPDATLDDLAAACGCTRSTAQRALQRIERLARGAPQGARTSGAGHASDRAHNQSPNAPFGPVRIGMRGA